MFQAHQDLQLTKAKSRMDQDLKLEWLLAVTACHKFSTLPFFTLLIFHTPHFKHSSLSTLFIFHTPHFSHSALRATHSTLPVFHRTKINNLGRSHLKEYRTHECDIPGCDMDK